MLRPANQGWRNAWTGKGGPLWRFQCFVHQHSPRYNMIQSWSGLGLSNPVGKYVDQLGIIIPTKSPTKDRKGRRSSAAGQTCSGHGSLWRLSFMLYEQWLGNRQRIIQDEKPSQAVLSVAGRCWKMLFPSSPPSPGSVQILILDARVLIFYLLMPWWLRVVPWNHGLLDLWKMWLPHKAAQKAWDD